MAPDTPDVDDPRVVLVTGASRGVGAATAVWLGRAGVRVALVARSESGLAATADGITAAGGTALVLAADLAQPVVGAEAVAAVLDRWGRLDAVINNAAVIEPIARIADVDADDWAHTLSVDLVAPLRLLQASVPALREHRGRVINLISTAAHLPLAGLSAYCAAKAGLHLLTQVLAVEEPAVTTMSVQPGPVDTDMQGSLRSETDALNPERLAYYRSLAAEQQLRPPDVPGRSLAWLALSAPPAWTGREIAFDDPAVLQGADAQFGPLLQGDEA